MVNDARRPSGRYSQSGTDERQMGFAIGENQTLIHPKRIPNSWVRKGEKAKPARARPLFLELAIRTQVSFHFSGCLLARRGDIWGDFVWGGASSIRMVTPNEGISHRKASSRINATVCERATFRYEKSASSAL